MTPSVAAQPRSREAVLTAVGKMKTIDKILFLTDVTRMKMRRCYAEKFPRSHEAQLIAVGKMKTIDKILFLTDVTRMKMRRCYADKDTNGAFSV